MRTPPSQIEQWPAADLLRMIRHLERDPFGPIRDNIHMALLADTVLRAVGNQSSKAAKYIRQPSYDMPPPTADQINRAMRELKGRQNVRN